VAVTGRCFGGSLNSTPTNFHIHKAIFAFVKTRDLTQIRSHAQKYFKKQKRDQAKQEHRQAIAIASGVAIPPSIMASSVEMSADDMRLSPSESRIAVGMADDMRLSPSKSQPGALPPSIEQQGLGQDMSLTDMMPAIDGGIGDDLSINSVDLNSIANGLSIGGISIGQDGLSIGQDGLSIGQDGSQDQDMKSFDFADFLSEANKIPISETHGEMPPPPPPSSE